MMLDLWNIYEKYHKVETPMGGDDEDRREATKSSSFISLVTSGSTVSTPGKEHTLNSHLQLFVESNSRKRVADICRQYFIGGIVGGFTHCESEKSIRRMICMICQF